MTNLTVEGLIDILKQYNPKREVLVAKDPEGERFSPLSEVTTISLLSISSENIGDHTATQTAKTTHCILLHPTV